MRRSDLVLVSAIGVSLALGACRHGNEEGERTKTSVTTSHRGMGDDDRPEVSQDEATRTTTDQESGSHDTGEAASEKEAVDRYASGQNTDSTSRYSTSGSDRYSSGAPMDTESRDENTTADLKSDPALASTEDEAGTPGSAPLANNPPPAHRHHQLGADTTMLGDTDATARLTSTGPAAAMSGMIGLKKMSNGARLIVHIDDAEPGRYAIQILDGDSSCTALDDTRGTEETTGGGMTKGSKGAIASKKVLARVDVGQDRTGHADVRVTRGQLGTKNFDDLAQRVLIIREDKKSTTAGNTAGGTASETGVLACGAIDVEDAG